MVVLVVRLVVLVVKLLLVIKEEVLEVVDLGLELLVVNQGTVEYGSIVDRVLEVVFEWFDLQKIKVLLHCSQVIPDSGLVVFGCEDLRGVVGRPEIVLLVRTFVLEVVLL